MSVENSETILIILTSINIILTLITLIFAAIAIKKANNIFELLSSKNNEPKTTENTLDDIKEYIDEKTNSIEKNYLKIYDETQEIKKALLSLSSELNETEKELSSEYQKKEEPIKEKPVNKKTIEGIYTLYLNKKGDVPKQLELKKLHIEDGDVRFSNSESDGVDCYIYIKKQDKNNSDIDVKAYIFPERAMTVERGEVGYGYYEDIYDFKTGTGKIELVKPCTAIANINGKFEKIQRGLIYLP